MRRILSLSLPFVVLAIAGTARLHAAQPHGLITEAIDETKLVSLAGNTRPEAVPANDRGRVADDFDMGEMQLVLKRSPEQEAAVAKRIEELHDRRSPNFHKWMTIDQIRAEFGASPQDVARISGWLQSHGFAVRGLYENGLVLHFSGTAGQVREAFHTEIHTLSVGGATHVANMADPRIPEALTPAVHGIASLYDFKPHTLAVKRVNDNIGSGNNALAPADLAVIYNINPLYKIGISGRGQKIYLIEDTNLYTLGDFNVFRKRFGLARLFPYGNLTQVNPTGSAATCSNPGVNGDEIEASIDVEWATATAPNASIVEAACASSRTQFGGFLALQNLFATAPYPPVVSISYGEAEASNGATQNLFISNLYQTGVLEGVSIFVSSGDEGAASADANSSRASHGINVSGFTSTPYNVSVGGTDFGVYAPNGDLDGTYFSSTNNAVYGSALSYIPEIPWNDSCAGGVLTAYLGFATPYGSAGLCNSSTASSDGFINDVAGSGGPSSCATGTASTRSVTSGTCAGWPKPSWQSIVGNPADGVRDIPDVSLFASNGFWGSYYIVCDSDPSDGSSCLGDPSTWLGYGGTSVSSPIMAGIQALVNQYTGTTWGNPNPTLYSLAATEYGASGNTSCNSTLGNAAASSCLFYDITQGDIDVDCTGTHNCYLPSGTYGILSTSNSSPAPAYGTGTGWDFSTGIGSVNAYNLVTGW